MLEIILQNFQEDNNVINIAANEKFMKSKNYIHHALSIQKRFLIIHESYADNFEILSKNRFINIVYHVKHNKQIN